MLEMESRGEERVQIQQPETFLSYRHSDLVIATEVVDLEPLWGAFYALSQT